MENLPTVHAINLFLIGDLICIARLQLNKIPIFIKSTYSSKNRFAICRKSLKANVIGCLAGRKVQLHIFAYFHLLSDDNPIMVITVECN